MTTDHGMVDLHSYCISVETRELYLHGHVGDLEEDPGVEYRSAALLIKNLRFLDSQSHDPILIHMHSIGGYWQSGMAMFDAIKACQSPVNILSYGQAESMSSIVLQAAKTRILMPNSYIMAHYGSTEIVGDHLEAQAQAKYERVICDMMMKIYAERVVKSQFFKDEHSGGDERKAQNYLARKLKNGAWYLEPEDAVYYGFADHVLGGRKYKTIDSIL